MNRICTLAPAALIAIISLTQSYVQIFKKVHLTVRPAVGSDQLFRPEDEDSPEFKEYLKNLLKMQANRAKTGFSAASSGSSDAYFAKLTRLKIERNARIRAGIPDDNIDTSYKEIDFINAK